MNQAQYEAMFNASKEDTEILSKIADRAVKLAREAGVRYRKSDAMMDLEACHCNGTPLKLQELLAAEDNDFGHDVFGIRRHLDRSTGKLQDQFFPRYGQPEKAKGKRA